MNHIQWIPPKHSFHFNTLNEKDIMLIEKKQWHIIEVSNEVFVIILVLCDCGLLLICNIAFNICNSYFVIEDVN